MKSRSFMVSLVFLLLASATRSSNPESTRAAQQSREPSGPSITPEKMIASKQVFSAPSGPSATSRDSASAQSCDSRLIAYSQRQLVSLNVERPSATEPS
jgi:hypothetical protein